MYANLKLDEPDFYVNLDKLNNPSQIYGILRSKKVRKKYCYALMYRKNFMLLDILKIGESCPEPSPNTNKAVGERLGRQIAWLDGWDTFPKSSHGHDLRLNIINEINNKLIPDYVLDRNNISVGIWDLDNRVPLNLYSYDRELTTWAEGELVNQYKRTHNNFLPVLNYKDPTNNKSYKLNNIDIKNFQTLFHQQ